jgi:DNA polymerase-3 subunit delta
MTGGLMTNLDTEIEKLISYCTGDRVTTEDIDAIVTPELNAAIYQLTDSISKRDYDTAARKLWELQAQNEPANRILAGISSVLRQLLAAKLLIKAGKNYMDLKEICRIHHDFQARNIVSASRKLSLDECVRNVEKCAEAMYMLRNGGVDDDWVLSWLLLELSGAGREAG